jgi:hypothetical protein
VQAAAAAARSAACADARLWARAAGRARALVLAAVACCAMTAPPGAALASFAAARLSGAAGLSGAALAGQTSPFAELSVTAYGAQRFDLATGFTELPDGGEVVDRGSGLRLQASWIRYAEGVILEATDARVSGPFGEVDAARLLLDLEARRLHAAGGVTLSTALGDVRAQTLRFDADDGWLLARGAVTSDALELEADGILVDPASGRIVLLPPYAYVDGPISLRADAQGAPLQLTPQRDDDLTIVGFDASTTLDDDVRRRLTADTE